MKTHRSFVLALAGLAALAPFACGGEETIPGSGATGAGEATGVCAEARAHATECKVETGVTVAEDVTCTGEAECAARCVKNAPCAELEVVTEDSAFTACLEVCSPTTGDGGAGGSDATSGTGGT